MAENIREKIKTFPLESGVYIMHNSSGKIIYIGKAKSLKKRVSQYFLPGRDVKTTALVSHIADIEYIITSNEYEALLLENNLIKKHKPRYNIDLKDDKTYQMIKITHEDFPRVLKTRRRSDDKAKYFGPYPKGQDLDIYFKMLENNFIFRRCNNLKAQKSECVYYHIGKCSAPCTGKISSADYMIDINKIEHTLNGNAGSVLHKIEKQMKEHAARLEFELAKKDKEVLQAVQRITASQSVSNQNMKLARDYIAIYNASSFVSVDIMQYRNGNLIGNKCFRLKTFAENDDVLTDFILQYYNNEIELPNIIFLSFEIDKDLIEQYFSLNFKSVKIEYPKKGADFRITEMVRINAQDNLNKYLRKYEN